MFLMGGSEGREGGDGGGGGWRTYVAVGLDGSLDAHVGAQGDLGDVVEELQAVQVHGSRVLHHGLFGWEGNRRGYRDGE